MKIYLIKLSVVMAINMAMISTLAAQNSAGLPAGNIGIGTTNPLTKLHIGSGKEIITSTDYTYGQLQVLNPLDGEASISIACNGTGPVIDRTTYARHWLLGINAFNAGMNNFSISNPMISNAGFVFTYDGKMGIGTNAPGECKLAVEGIIGARRIKVKQGSWADYVFRPDYELPSLEYLEKFVRENQHLPEIPTEQQVTDEGLDVGEMNKLLLKKVEELTLYIIQLNKKIDAQQAATAR